MACNASEITQIKVQHGTRIFCILIRNLAAQRYLNFDFMVILCPKTQEIARNVEMLRTLHLWQLRTFQKSGVCIIYTIYCFSRKVKIIAFVIG